MKPTADIPGSSTTGLLTIASYNVHRCIGVDWRPDPDRVVRVIRELDADVLALQEVESSPRADGGVDQLEYLARATGYEAVAGPMLARRHAHGNAVLTRRRVCVLRRIDLCMPGREPRGALDVDLECGTETLRVIATHLGLRAGERRRQIARLLEVLADVREPVVILGDFNHWLPRPGPLASLDARFGRVPVLRTFPSWRPLLALDRLWVCPREALVALGVHVTPLARMASDHLPLRASLRLH